MTQLTGRHVFAMFAFGFATIIAVNLILAFNAVASFPGVEVKNSYLASQAFDRTRAAQEALNWEVSATLFDDKLTLRFDKDGQPIKPQIISAVFGRATSVAADQHPGFIFDQGAFTAQVDAAPGNWNLRIVAQSDNGTRFQQRIIVEVLK